MKEDFSLSLDHNAHWRQLVYATSYEDVTPEMREVARKNMHILFGCDEWITQDWRMIPIRFMQHRHYFNCKNLVLREIEQAYRVKDEKQFNRRYGHLLLLREAAQLIGLPVFPIPQIYHDYDGELNPDYDHDDNVPFYASWWYPD